MLYLQQKNKSLKNVTLTLNKKAIQQSEYVKYLGVLIDSRLSFSHHITSISKKMSRVTGLMYRIRSCVNNKTLKMIYYSLIYPHLLYGIPIWGNADDIHINPLLILQKKAVRLIMNKQRNIHTIYKLPGEPITYWYVDTFLKVPSGPLFIELEILYIQDIFKMITLNFVYDSLHKLNPEQFHVYYRHSANIHNTAASRDNNLDTPMVRTVTYGLKSIKYTGCILWNDLPMAVRNATCKKSFTRSVKKHLISTYQV